MATEVMRLGGRWPGPGLIVSLGAPLLVFAGSRIAPGASTSCQAISMGASIVGTSAVMLLPGLAALCLFYQRAKSPVGLATSVGVTLVSGTALAWLSFWLWMASPLIGRLSSLAFYVAAATVLVTRRRWVIECLGKVVMVCLIGCGSCLFLSAVYYLHGGESQPTEAAENGIFGTDDNIFPAYWAQRVDNGTDTAVSWEGWPLSDRPPLQTALTLPTWHFSTNKDVTYQFSSEPLETLAVSAVAVILLELGLRRWRLLGGVALVTCTGFMLANTTFVWPKLFSASALLLAVAMLLESAPRVGLREAVMIGCCCAISALAHPGGAYSFPAVLILAAALGARRRWMTATWAGVGFFAFLSPWIAYKLFVDQSPSILLKLHLAGVVSSSSQPTHESLLTTIARSYRALGLRGWLTNRGANLASLVRLRGLPVKGVGLASYARITSTFSPLWSGGILLGALPGVIALGRKGDRRTLWLGIAGMVTILLWTVLEFGPPYADTVTHQGPYAAFLLVSISLATMLVKTVPGRAVVLLVAVQVSLFLWYSWSMGATNRCTASGMCSIISKRGKITSTGIEAVGSRGSIFVPIVVLGVVGVVIVVFATLSIGSSGAKHRLRGGRHLFPAEEAASTRA